MDAAGIADTCVADRRGLAAVEGEHHALGLRMAGYILELAGFEVIYLGADVPLDTDAFELLP
jgi:cobalamin-dependent methionine synthase I